MADVLIVDDNLDACRPLVRLLKYFGTGATCAESGEKALDYLRSKIPKLVLLDVMMPGMDGFEVLEQIRLIPAMAKLPVVMFSASGDPEHIARAKSLGANDYWLKGGMEIDRLREMIDSYLQPSQ